MSGTAFSFDELQSAKTVELPDLESLTASDGVRLSYRRYIPITPRAVVLFYHGESNSICQFGSISSRRV